MAANAMVETADELRVADVLQILPVCRVTLYSLEERGRIRPKRDDRHLEGAPHVLGVP